MENTYDILIVGSGPAGYSAAIYAKRAGMKTAIVTGLELGGQLMQTTDVENYPGFIKTEGPALMEQMYKQVEALSVDIHTDNIEKIDFSSYPYKLKGIAGSYLAKSIVLATGSSAKWLHIDGEEEFKGYGVSACATCDGFFFSDQSVAVVGGGNTAIEEAIYLSNIAKEVTLIHRRDSLRGEQILQDKLFSIPNIKIKWDTVVDKIQGTESGEKSVTSLVLSNLKTKESEEFKTDALFIAIGHNPNTEFVKGSIDLDEEGYIITESDSVQVTKDGKALPGVFAAGDVQDKIYRQAVTSAGTGCMAALDAKRFLDSH